MTDISTRAPICVESGDDIRPFIELPLDQVDAVCRLLDSHGFRDYEVEETVLSINGGPELVIIDLVADPAVQTILDSVP